MRVAVTNSQRHYPVNTAQMRQVAWRAMQRLGLRGQGTMAVTFIGQQQMRHVHQTFLRDDSPTDVITFRYPGEPIIGELLIAPAAAHRYAMRHSIPYRVELARYVLHGLLHWKGYEDRTSAQQRRMRRREDELLAHCGIKVQVNGSAYR